MKSSWLLLLEVTVFSVVRFVCSDTGRDTQVNKSETAHNPLIWRGTKWCGLGSLPKYNDSDVANGTDKCCRHHDSCPLYILRWKRAYNLYNWRPYTISSCLCDKDFHNCLSQDASQTSKDVRTLYFDIIQVPCFHLVIKEKTVCLERTWYFKCKKYGKRVAFYAELSAIDRT